MAEKKTDSTLKTRSLGKPKGPKPIAIVADQTGKEKKRG